MGLPEYGLIHRRAAGIAKAAAHHSSSIETANGRVARCFAKAKASAEIAAAGISIAARGKKFPTNPDAMRLNRLSVEPQRPGSALRLVRISAIALTLVPPPA